MSDEIAREWIDGQLECIKRHPAWEPMRPFAEKLFEAAMRIPERSLMVDCGVGAGGSSVILALANYCSGSAFVVRAFDRSGIALRDVQREVPQSGVGFHFVNRWMFINQDSVRAAEQVFDDTVGIIVLDSKHTFAHVTAELEAWSPKVVQGGQIWVHDYNNINAGLGVREAVAMFMAGHTSGYSLEILAEPPGFAIITKGENDGSQQSDLLHGVGDGGAAGVPAETDNGGNQGTGDGAVETDGVSECPSILGHELQGGPGESPGVPTPPGESLNRTGNLGREKHRASPERAGRDQG